jgi:hypothetical protein
MGEQVLAKGPTERSKLLRPVVRRVRDEVEIGVRLIDQRGDQIGLVAHVGVQRVRGDSQPLGEATHRKLPAAGVFEQGERLVNEPLTRQRGRPHPGHAISPHLYSVQVIVQRTVLAARVLYRRQSGAAEHRAVAGQARRAARRWIAMARGSSNRFSVW